MTSFRSALALLTIIPVGAAPPQRSMSAWFPLVGALIGVACAGAGWAGEWLWGTPFHALAVVTSGALVTGALHLDGVADCSDALFLPASRERRLEVLRDSRIGAFGVLGVLAVVALKLAALAHLGPHWFSAAWVTPALARWSVAWSLFRFPSARSDGLGRLTHDADGHGSASMLWATFTAAGVVAWLAPGLALTLCVAAVATTECAGRWMAARFGGLTGDAYGTLIELCECACLLAWLALAHHEWV